MLLEIDVPASKAQITLAQHLIKRGAPNPDQVHDGMTRREVEAWIDEATKTVSLSRPAVTPPHLMNAKPRDQKLVYARDLAAYAGLEVPYDEAQAKHKDVADFIFQCRDELRRQGKPPNVPTGPASKGQRRRLRELGATLPEGATWGEAHEKLQELKKASEPATSSEEKDAEPAEKSAGAGEEATKS
ncbi:hypothetical protein CALCODRAFT_489869 [Calocera cornea HHB12733]|uniref:Uncharacterized protein n=1 Tax=Calocera cornea HHB12733 TaxID=1353952 RepID=A0A165K067_9BASI|nr:hypothetical protein CALCODRAFT_489869 [Calocera cornea HHB12733]